MKQSRKDFIKKAHENACSEWKTNIEKEFPKLFKEDALVVGKWYKHCSGGLRYLVCSVGNGLAYGFMDGIYHTKLSFGSQRLEEGCIPATDKEVERALIKEAKRRGFKEGVSVSNENIGYFYEGMCNSNEITFENGILSIDSIYIYKKGKWATIIKETITKEQAEKELGKTILN